MSILSDRISGFIQHQFPHKPQQVARCQHYPDCFCGRGKVVCHTNSQWARLAWPKPKK